MVAKTACSTASGQVACAQCKRWRPVETDMFCAWCGAKLVDFTLELSPPHIYVGDIPLAVELRIANSGCFGSIEIRAINVDKPWLVPQPGKLSGPIRHGGSATVQFQPETWSLEDGYHDTLVEVQTTAGGKQARFSVVPHPDAPQVTAGKFEIYLDEIESEHNECHISLERGVVTIESIVTDAKWATVRLRPGDELPLVMDARNRQDLTFELVVNEGELMQHSSTFPATFEGAVMVRFRELERTTTTPFIVECFKPPELHVLEEEDPRINLLAGRTGLLNLTLWNGSPVDPDKGRGRALLRVFAIDLPSGGGTVCTWARPSEPLKMPLEIAGGNCKEVAFEIATAERLEGPGLPPGKHNLQLAFSTNEVQARRTIIFEITVSPIPKLEGLIAVDYGTTNTCAAVLYADGEETLLNFEERRSGNTHSPTTIPSVSQYRDLLPDGTRKYEIGFGPAGLMLLREMAESIVTSAKRYLGSSHVFPITFSDNKTLHADYTAQQIVGDYLWKVRDSIEEQLRARVRRVIMTHPSRFTLAQINQLRSAAESCFGTECHIEHMQEPIAAALSEIVQEKMAKRPRYTLMVYDFGGGTTDITLLEVENAQENGALITRPRVLGTDGHNGVGGDDATQILMDMTVKNCEKVYKKLHSDARNFLIPLDPDRFTQPFRRRKAEENRMTLRTWAEWTKIQLSNYGDKHDVPDDYKRLKLHLFRGDIEEEAQLPYEEVAPRQEDFDGAIREWLITRKPVEIMKKLAERKGVEVNFILLAGKSSKLPPLLPLVKEHFPDADLIFPGDLKECVVRGALMLEKFRVGGRHQIDIDNGAVSATTSRIGRLDVQFDKQLFAEIVPAGEPIPDKGLLRSVHFPTGIKRGIKIGLLENTSLDDQYVVNGKKNPWIVRHGDFELANLPPDITDSELTAATIELLISRNLDLTLQARIRGANNSHERIVPFLQVRAEERIAHA